MPEITYSQLKGQLLILQQISNPSPYIVDAISQIKKDLINLESEDHRFRLIDKATQEIEAIKQKYPDLNITYTIRQHTTIQEHRKTPRIIFKSPVQIVTHINAQNASYTFTDPRSIIFNNIEYSGVKVWKDVLEQVCNLMQNIHPNEITRILHLRGRTRVYFTHNLNQLSSKEARERPRKIKNTDIYMEHNYSANTIVKLCYEIVEYFGHKSDNLKFITK